jgi:hypothetical protein
MIELESMAVEMPVVEGHPNRAGFRGVLTLVDVPSQRAPSGAKRHRVVLTRKAAEAALPSLIGMALDYAPSFDRHDVRRKVGIITKADVVGRNLEVGGYLYARDFPEVVEEVGKFGRKPVEFVRACREGLAMAGAADVPTVGGGQSLRASLAYAVAQLREMTSGMKGAGSTTRPEAGGGALGMSFEVTHVTLADSRSRIWTLTGVMFTGAAILRKEKAAFQDTWIELAPSP